MGRDFSIVEKDAEEVPTASTKRKRNFAKNVVGNPFVLTGKTEVFVESAVHYKYAATEYSNQSVALRNA